VASAEDGGQYLTCRAENHELPASVMEDTLKLDVQCKYLLGYSNKTANYIQQFNPTLLSLFRNKNFKKKKSTMFLILCLFFHLHETSNPNPYSKKK
jgi:hypothetical protein